MKNVFLMIAFGVSLFSYGQKQKHDTTVRRFNPPVIVKDEDTGKQKPRLAPPRIVKDKPHHPSKPKAMFTPPVIVKDSTRQE